MIDGVTEAEEPYSRGSRGIVLPTGLAAAAEAAYLRSCSMKLVGTQDRGEIEPYPQPAFGLTPANPRALRMLAEAMTPSDLFLELLRRFPEECVEYVLFGGQAVCPNPSA